MLIVNLNSVKEMRSFLSTKAAVMVYMEMILPILEYGDVFLQAASVENRKWLQTIQNKGLRCTLNKGRDKYDELHKEANLLKLCYRREQHILNFVFCNTQLVSNLRVSVVLMGQSLVSNIPGDKRTRGVFFMGIICWSFTYYHWSTFCTGGQAFTFVAAALPCQMLS